MQLLLDVPCNLPLGAERIVRVALHDRGRRIATLLPASIQQRTMTQSYTSQHREYLGTSYNTACLPQHAAERLRFQGECLGKDCVAQKNQYQTVLRINLEESMEWVCW